MTQRPAPASSVIHVVARGGMELGGVRHYQAKTPSLGMPSKMDIGTADFCLTCGVKNDERLP